MKTKQEKYNNTNDFETTKGRPDDKNKYKTTRISRTFMDHKTDPAMVKKSPEGSLKG